MNGKYNRVTETHDGKKHSLNCFDPGSTDCVWTVQPTVRGASAQQAQDAVEAEINKGNLSGSVQFNGAVLDWSGTDLDNYVFSIDDLQS